MASEISPEALGVRNAFSYVDMGKVRGFEPQKAILKFNTSVCDYK